MSVILYNNGEVKVPDVYLREGIHYFLLKPNEWNHLVWEIDSLARDKVTGLEFVYRLQGSDVGAAKNVCYDIDLIELEKVAADPYEGWTIPQGEISFCHTGYSEEARKIALGNGMEEEEFHVRDVTTDQVMFTALVKTIDTPLGNYQELDFSELRTQGTYRIESGEMKTQSFQIAKDIWRGTI